MERQLTQKQTVLKKLQDNKKGVTNWEFIVEHHITRASSYVCDLRREGHKIRTVNEPIKKGGSYARYIYEGGPDETDRV